jgi:uncharacterized membrane protein
MIFANPAGLLLLLTIPLLIFLHTIKRHHRRQLVPSLLLWGPGATPQPSRAFLRHLPVNLLLFLQILFLLCLSLALAQPEFRWRKTGIRRVALLLDTSASMQATDVSPSRFEAARAEALTLVDRLEPGREVLVMEAGARPILRQPFTRERGQVQAVLHRMTPQDGSAAPLEALELLHSVAGSEPVEIHLFTDGAYDRLDWSPPEGKPVTMHRVGVRSRNVGITAFRIRKTFYSPSHYELFMALHNTADEAMSFSLALTLDGQLLHRERIALPPKTRRTLLVPILYRGGGVVEATIDLADDLEVDNRAYAVIPPPELVKVLLVSEGNLFLEKALTADPHVQVTVVNPEAFPQLREGQDVIVLDRYSPSSIPPGRYLLIRSVPGNVPIEVLGTIRGPRIVDWDRTHPIMRYLDLSQVVVEEALKVRPLAGAVTLMESPLSPMALAFHGGGYRLVLLGFNPLQSDLPLRAAFPLFVSNALRWLHPTRMEDIELQGQVGAHMRITLDPTVRQANLTDPEGQRHPLAILSGRGYLPTPARAGIYRVQWERGERQIAVNLTDEAESNLTPRISLPPSPPLGKGTEFEVTWGLWRPLLLLALSVLVVEISLAYLRGRRGPLFLITRGGGLLCLAWALVNPQIPWSVDRLNVLFLLDTSDSVPLTEQLRAWDFVQEAVKTKGDEDTAGLITFARRPKVEVPLHRDPAFIKRPEPVLEREATDLAAALRTALIHLPTGGQSRVVLLSDGQENVGNLLEEGLSARDKQVEAHVLPLGTWREGEVLVERLSLPQEVKEGEVFTLRLILWSAKETPARITLSKNGQFLGAQTVRLASGKNVLAYRQTLPEGGFHIYQASIEAPDDTLEANNRAMGVVAVRGRPRILYAEKDQGQAQHLVKVLKAQQLQVDLIDPAELPKELIGLVKYDTLILSSISALRLSRGQMEFIRSYVRDHGGGLIMLGGEESFGIGGYFHTPVEEALPVTMETRQRLEVPSLAVVLVIDRSGSMDAGAGQFTKLDLAKEAAQLVVELLDRRSEAGVVAFDTTPTWVVPLEAAADKERIHYEIAAVKSGGGTDIFPALKEAYQALFQREARLKHLILLSDGQSATADFAALVHRMARDRITVSAVAIGRDADTRLMRDISRWGRGRYYYTEDAQSLPRIFTLETQLASKAAVVEEPFRPVVAQPLHEILQNIDWRTTPPLGGYVATTPKSTAELLLTSPEGDPLLAVWRYGIGRSAAFTSDAKARWGVLWLQWEGFPRLFAQLVRWTLRQGERREVVAEFDRQGERGVISVEAATGQGEFLNFLEAQAGIITPDKSRTVVELRQVAPGRYEGEFPLRGEGTYLVGVVERREGKTLHSELGSLILPYYQEYQHLGVNLPLLKEVVELTGGRVLERAEEVFRTSRRSSAVPYPLWPSLVGGSLLLFFGELVSRRFIRGKRGVQTSRGGGGGDFPPRWVKGRGRR